MALHPKHDYDSDAFYNLVERAASVLAMDKDVATVLGLDEETFICMKKGYYLGWDAEQNKRRSERLLKVLTRARANSKMSVWNAMLRLGAGATKVKSRSKRGVGIHCECQGKNKSCPICGGSGWTMSEDDVIITETESEVAPSLQAMHTWLYHHDENFRRIQRGEEPETDSATAEEGTGISVDAWLRREIEQNGSASGKEEEPEPIDLESLGLEPLGDDTDR